MTQASQTIPEQAQRWRATIPGTPHGQGSMRIIAGRALHPTTTRDHRAYVTAHLAAARDGRPPIEGPVKLHAEFHFPRPRNHYRTGRWADVLRDDAPALHARTPDLDKLVRLIGDALTAAGVIGDDRQLYELHASKAWTSGAAGWTTIYLNQLAGRELKWHPSGRGGAAQ
jgi:crossover junction endodeoxyribonuclease RusA